MEEINKGLVVFGIILLIIGLVASFYQEKQLLSSDGMSRGEIVIPYRNVGIGLAVAGIVFIASGFLLSIAYNATTKKLSHNAQKS